MYQNKSIQVNREYLQKLRDLIDHCQKEGKNFVKEFSKISLTKKYKIDNINGVGESKIERISEYMSENGVYRTCDLVDYDLTQISGVGESVEQKIKDRIYKMKDKLTEFK